MTHETIGRAAMAVALVAAVPGLAHAFGAKTLDEAITMAGERNQPILLELGTEW